MNKYGAVSILPAGFGQFCFPFLLLFAFVVMPAGAQTTTPRPDTSPEVNTLAQGWAALRQGDLAQATAAAERAVTESPRSAAAVALAVEVDIARGGSLAGLAIYERWLGVRKVDDPYVLRRVAHAHLRRAVQERQHPARLEAAKALTAEGDRDAEADLASGAANGGHAERRLLASLGDSRAVQMLIAQLRAPGGGKLGIINALVESGSRLAIPPLTEMLGDIREDHRAAAADGLGRLGASEAIPRIKPLLNDPVFPVRMSAASALYRLEDYSGVNLLDELMTSEHGAIRLGAAEAMSVRPAGSWLSVVRELTRDQDATVQLGAARLIAPYEPDLAAAVLERLRQSDNLAVREEAGRIFVQRVAGDFAALRRFLHSPDRLTSVRAADRILELTR